MVLELLMGSLCENSPNYWSAKLLCCIRPILIFVHNHPHLTKACIFKVLDNFQNIKSIIRSFSF